MAERQLALRRMLAPLDTLLDWFIIANILAISLLVFGQVVLRYVFRSPLMGIEELCYFPTTWLYLFAAAKASSEQNQLIARVLEIFFHKKKSVCLLRAIAAILATGVLCWLTWWGYDLLKYSLRVEKLSDTLFIPTIYMDASVFVCFGLMLLYTVVEFIDYMHLFLTTSPDVGVLSGEEKI